MNISLDLELEIQRDIFRENYHEFFKVAVKQLEPETDWSVDNWHIVEACNIFQEAVERVIRKEQKPYDLSFNLPPSSSKSMIFSVCSIAWIWSFAPHIRLATDSHKRALSQDHCRKTGKLINSSWYKELYGHVFYLTKDTEERIENDKGGIRVAYCDTGFHYDIIIGDDLLNAQGGASEAEIKAANDFWFKTVPSRFRSQTWGLKVLVMQRLAQNDPCGIIKERNLNYRHFIVPAILTKDLTPYEDFKDKYESGTFWPDRFPMHIIEEKQKEMSESDFASQYLQSPTPPTGGMVKYDWFKIVEPHEVSRNPLTEPILFFIDTSQTENELNDPNGYLACFRRGADLYIINCHEEWNDIVNNLEYIKNFTKANGYTEGSIIFFEPKNNAKDIVNIYKKHTNLNCAFSKTPTKDKVYRLNASIPFIRSGRVILVNGAWVKPFLSQVCSQPFASRWDMTDVLNMSIDELLMNEGFGFFFA